MIYKNPCAFLEVIITAAILHTRLFHIFCADLKKEKQLLYFKGAVFYLYLFYGVIGMTVLINAA